MSTLKHALFAAGFSILLHGCASQVKYPWKDVSYPLLNQTSTAFLGDRLLMQGRGFETDILETSYLKGKYGEVNAGRFCKALGKKNQFFSFDPGAVTFTNFVGGYRGQTNEVTYDEAKNKVCIDDMWTGCFDSSYGSFRVIKNSICSDPNSYQQIIEYNGKSSDILNFTYREVQNNRLLTPYTTNFTMDLKEGNTIVYKGAKIEVESASNQEIVYRVLKNFNNGR